MRIAVIGAGVSGLGAAWLLSRRHEVVLFEKEPRIGGHSNTVVVRDAAAPAGEVPVDTGFIVYNTACYPALIALFRHLSVPTARTHMGFAVSLGGGAYEYSGSGAQGLFGQPANLLSPAHWRMSADILRFFREAKALIDAADDESLGGWLARRGYGAPFVDRHILPMAAAIWSTPSRDVLDFPAAAFARFFSNHGLLQVRNRPEWRTVAGGSREYVARLRQAFRGRIAAGDPVVAVARDAAGATVTTASGASARFDACLVATHADEALALLADADGEERRLLGAFRYAANEAVLHRDARLMPRRRRLWSSWNYLGGTAATERGEALAVTYWMNKLQPLDTGTDHFVTLNPTMAIPDALVAGRFRYHHPMYDGRAIAAQKELHALQGRRRTWFAGSYFGWGFHEDALQSGLWAAEDLGGIARPWDATGQTSRLSLPSGGRGPRPALGEAAE